MAAPLLYLSGEDVQASALSPAELVACVERAFTLHAKGGVLTSPKTGLYTEDGSFFFSLPAASQAMGYAIVHASMGTPPDRAQPGRPHIHSLEILVDAHTTLPLAVIDALWVTNMIPAAVTALVAKYMARADSRVAGFVATGAQARSNLATLREVLPLTTVLAFDERPEAAAAFAHHAESLGLRAEIATHPMAVVSAADVLVTSVPSMPGMQPTLAPAWLPPGCFVSMVDLARSWMPGLEVLDRFVTDDRAQAANQVRDGRLRFAGPYDTEIAELLSGRRPGRTCARERIAFIHPGHAIGILAIAAALYERARAAGRGTELPRGQGS